mmetsp:Transcript_63126/g.181580  ORF Transcript_63126/g.181580 Transcript_63126/m.181580 type:complete len:395 (+) Transcript_63126:734-1918(+)
MASSRLLAAARAPLSTEAPKDGGPKRSRSMSLHNRTSAQPPLLDLPLSSLVGEVPASLMHDGTLCGDAPLPRGPALAEAAARHSKSMSRALRCASCLSTTSLGHELLRRTPLPKPPRRAASGRLGGSVRARPSRQLRKFCGGAASGLATGGLLSRDAATASWPDLDVDASLREVSCNSSACRSRVEAASGADLGVEAPPLRMLKTCSPCSCLEAASATATRAAQSFVSASLSDSATEIVRAPFSCEMQLCKEFTASRTSRAPCISAMSDAIMLVRSLAAASVFMRPRILSSRARIARTTSSSMSCSSGTGVPCNLCKLSDSGSPNAIAWSFWKPPSKIRMRLSASSAWDSSMRPASPLGEALPGPRERRLRADNDASKSMAARRQPRRCHTSGE